jgi:putative spermidine/putrescine transport system permease protein
MAMATRSRTREIASPSARTGQSLLRAALRLVQLAPVIGLLVVSFVWPLVTILMRSLNEKGAARLDAGLYFGNYASILSDSLLRQVAEQTAFLAAVAMAFTALLAFPTAYLMSRLSRRTAVVLLVLILIPFWVSILIRLFAFTAILGREGIVNSVAGVFGLGPYSLLFNTTATVIGMVAYLLPYMILILYAAMVGVDPSLMTAARTMGATGRQAFRQIYFPQIRPALVSGCMLVFVLALGFFLTPAILGGPQDLTIPVYIQQQITIFRWGRASAAGVALLIVSVVGYLLALRIGGASILVPAGRPVGRGVVARERLAWSPGTVLSWMATAVVLVLLLLPLLVVIPAAFGETTQIQFPPRGFTTAWFTSVLEDPMWTSALWKSVRVGVGTAVASTAIGLILARLGPRVKSSWARMAIQTIAFAPLIIPVILLAIGVYDVQVRLGLVGTDLGLVLAHCVICFPLAFLILSNALSNVDGSLEEAAWSMGVSRTKAFWTVVIPNILPALLGAALISFMTSWDEAVLALFQTSLDKTLPVTIYSFLKSGVTPAVAAVAVMLIAPVVLGVVIALVVGARKSRRSLV